MLLLLQRLIGIHDASASSVLLRRWVLAPVDARKLRVGLAVEVAVAVVDVALLCLAAEVMGERAGAEVVLLQQEDARDNRQCIHQDLDLRQAHSVLRLVDLALLLRAREPPLGTLASPRSAHNLGSALLPGHHLMR